MEIGQFQVRPITTSLKRHETEFLGRAWESSAMSRLKQPVQRSDALDYCYQKKVIVFRLILDSTLIFSVTQEKRHRLK